MERNNKTVVLFVIEKGDVINLTGVSPVFFLSAGKQIFRSKNLPLLIWENFVKIIFEKLVISGDKGKKIIIYKKSN